MYWTNGIINDVLILGVFHYINLIIYPKHQTPKKMQSSSTSRNVSLIYLTIVPALTVGLAFGVGHISYKLYLPIWIINSCIMVFALWVLGAKSIKSPDVATKHLVISSLLLIIPWIFITLFFGMGPPPHTLAGWAATVTEQQVRYNILIVCGILIAFGATLLSQRLKAAGEDLYSQLALSAIYIAVPLFIVNMAFWGAYLTNACTFFVNSGFKKSADLPGWFFPLRDLFELIAIVEAALFYLATALFAVSLKKAGWLKPLACNIYVVVSIIGLILTSLPLDVPEPLATLGYLSSIPAFTVVMLYLMSINLLRRIGN